MLIDEIISIDSAYMRVLATSLQLYGMFYLWERPQIAPVIIRTSSSLSNEHQKSLHNDSHQWKIEGSPFSHYTVW